jgi:hypothetical protein
MPEDYESYVPVERDGTRGDSAPNVSFMIHALLASRVESGMPSSEAPSEEDVNVYITHLLCDFVRPQYQMRVHKYISAYDSSVFERVRHTTNKRLKYAVYKANADHILVMMGVFHNNGRRSSSLPGPLQIEEDVDLGRGKSYYDYAFTYSRSLFGRSSAIPEVMFKLAHGFERYVKILTYMRSEYLNLVDRMSEGELFHLQRSVESGELPQLRDEFLEAWTRWRQNPSDEHRQQLQELVEHLRGLDPEFRFELPEN